MHSWRSGPRTGPASPGTTDAARSRRSAGGRGRVSPPHVAVAGRVACQLQLTYGRDCQERDLRPLAPQAEGSASRCTSPGEDRPSRRRQPRRREACCSAVATSPARPATARKHTGSPRIGSAMTRRVRRSHPSTAPTTSPASRTSPPTSRPPSTRRATTPPSSLRRWAPSPGPVTSANSRAASG